MIPFSSIVQWHCNRYAGMQPQDLIKLAYQSAKGSEHMLPDKQRVQQYLAEEIQRTSQEENGCLFTPLGANFCRLHLSAFAASGLRLETVAGMFTAAADQCAQNTLEENLATLEEMALQGRLCVNSDAVTGCLAQYRGMGCPAVHHSDEYRRLYAPAYRLVPADVAVYYSLFQKIDSVLTKKGSVRIAIDGMCGSGKTTLGNLLHKVYGGNLFHMDDFFLPFERKTPERLAEPGGNVDYERFAEEVACHTQTQAFCYRPFDCSTGTLAQPVQVQANPVWITEGAYSLHPTLRDIYDIRVFFTVQPQLQKQRILLRNGEKMLQRFIHEWIPMENNYFSGTNIQHNCHLHIAAEDKTKFYANFGLEWVY